MKYNNIFFAFLLSLIFVSCSGTTVINNPEIMATNTRYVEIERIELSDTATILYMDAYNEPQPGCWIRIASETCLEGNVTGKQYKLMRSEGFELDKEVNMPESGNVPFKLYFEPLDKKETAVDFVEGHSDGAFVINGIQLKERDGKGKIKCHISGTVVDRPQSSRLMLQPWNSDNRVYPWMSVPIHDGKFDYTFYAGIEEVYELIFYEEQMRGRWRSVYFFAEEGDIEFTLYPMDRWRENITSTKLPLNVVMNDYNEKLKAMFDYEQESLEAERNKLMEDGRIFSDEYKKWQEDYNKATTDEERDKLYTLQTEYERNDKIFSEEGKALNEKFHKLGIERNSWTLDYIKANPSLPAYYELISFVDYAIGCMQYDPAQAPDPAPYFAVYEEMYKNKYPGHPYTDKMEMYISSNSIKAGGKYIDFTAPDATGKEFKLSEQIAGKVALIDLWASWCGPCRRNSKSMIPVYEKYKDKGFIVVGVARERIVADMVHAAQSDGYTWLTLVELEDRGKIWQKYGIGNGGGSTFLVDKNGIILAINPTAEEVIAILEKEL